MTIPGGGYGNFTYNTDGSIELTSAVPATANRGLLSIGAGPWDGASAGHFAGAAVGTAIAVNAPSGYAGNLLDIQRGGISALTLTPGGLLGVNAISVPGNNNSVIGINTGGVSISNNSANSAIPLTINGGPAQTGDYIRCALAGVAQAGVRSDGLIYGTLNGLATKQKAGVPVDGDWAAGAPPNGTLVVDSTDSKLYVRVGGAWKGVVVA